MNYDKYIKYKNEYLLLKKIQMRGGGNKSMTENDINNAIDRLVRFEPLRDEALGAENYELYSKYDYQINLARQKLEADNNGRKALEKYDQDKLASAIIIRPETEAERLERVKRDAEREYNILKGKIDDAEREYKNNKTSVLRRKLIDANKALRLALEAGRAMPPMLELVSSSQAPPTPMYDTWSQVPPPQYPQLQPQPESIIPKLRRLINFGNTCFLNATIQAFRAYSDWSYESRNPDGLFNKIKKYYTDGSNREKAEAIANVIGCDITKQNTSVYMFTEIVRKITEEGDANAIKPMVQGTTQKMQRGKLRTIYKTTFDLNLGVPSVKESISSTINEFENPPSPAPKRTFDLNADVLVATVEDINALRYNFIIDTDMTIKNKQYILSGAVQHSGSDKGGHYVFLYKDPVEGWIKVNDLSRNLYDKSTAPTISRTTRPTLLFYRRI